MKIPARQRWKRNLVALALVAGLEPAALAQAGHQDGKVLIFAQPLARADAIWMAQAKGFFKEQKLDVAVRWWSSGTNALQVRLVGGKTIGFVKSESEGARRITDGVEGLEENEDRELLEEGEHGDLKSGFVDQVFQEGEDGKQRLGDFIVLNDLVAVNFWQSMEGKFALIAALARDGKGYVGIARSELKSPQALKGKTIATQLGSTGAWFLGEYLRAHGMSELDVAVKDMRPDAILEWDLAEADVAAFFVREPYGTQALAKYGDQVHRLTTAKGYMHGYLLLGTSQEYLHNHPGVAERLLKALDKGREYALTHKDEVIEFARGMFSVVDTAPVEADYASNERVVGLDRVTLEDFHKLSRWMKEAGLLKKKFDPTAFFDPQPLRAGLPERLAPEFRQ